MDEWGFPEKVLIPTFLRFGLLPHITALGFPRFHAVRSANGAGEFAFLVGDMLFLTHADLATTTEHNHPPKPTDDPKRIPRSTPKKQHSRRTPFHHNVPKVLKVSQRTTPTANNHCNGYDWV
jgi:hypothetical protein